MMNVVRLAVEKRAAEIFVWREELR